MKRQLISFFIAIFLFFPVSEKNLVAVDFKKYVFEKDKFSIKLPANWEVSEIHANNIVALVRKPPESKFDNFSEEILITAGYTEENPSTLEESLQVLLKQITFLYGNSFIYDTGADNFGGKDIVWVLYGEKTGNLDRKNINYIFVNGKYHYMLWCYSEEESFERMEPLFDEIAKSLTYLE